jgi:uncharacterized protein
LTSSITYTASGLIFNRATGLFNGIVTVTNTSASAISGPLQIAFSALPSAVTLNNASGNLGGTPYITTGTLGAGASINVPVQFRIQGSVRVSYTLAVYSGTL